ncbi:hypothetical protein [Mesotoga sp. H07.pep.5.3]|nr:hypothetical protein [Mesotoga sp. H07.pep.5.3]
MSFKVLFQAFSVQGIFDGPTKSELAFAKQRLASLPIVPPKT